MLRKIAIIIVNYNGLNDTCECIKSILNSTVYGDIFIVDNGSMNDEANQLKRLFPQIIVLNNIENKGFAAGNNQAIKFVLNNIQYEYIMLLNNDTIIDNRAIEILSSKVNNDTVIVPAIFYYNDKDNLWYGGGKINKWIGNSKHLCETEEEEVTFITGCCFIAHRDIFDKVGLLDERYFMYVEDMNFSIRLIESGVKLIYSPSAKIWHKVGKTTNQNGSSFSTYYITRNRLNCVREHKDFFYITAYPYSVISRLFRMIQAYLLGKTNYNAFLQAIIDHRKCIWGKLSQ